MYNLKQIEKENQEYILPDNFSRIVLAVFYLLLISAGILLYNFVILPEIERVKLLDFAAQYEITGSWIKLLLGFFIIPSAIMFIFGIKIIREKRYPSFGARVAVKTKIIRGKKAQNIGFRFLLFGIISIFMILSSITLTNGIRKSFAENPLKWASPKSWEKAGLQRPKF